ncbi:MAG: DNA-binding response regulator, partial [Rectinemataceae bacterium]|nr:DNA-binding response regulator [Rectinemataceae bacterium]
SIHLGSFEYLLKPVDLAELEEVLSHAAGKILNEKGSSRQQRFGQFWAKHQPLVIEHFWRDIIEGIVLPTPQAVCEAADSRNIPFRDDLRIQPLLFAIRNREQRMSMHEEKMREFTIKKKIEQELAEWIREGGIFFALKRGMLLGVLPHAEKMSEALLGERCATLIGRCRDDLVCEMSCYIGDYVFAYQLQDAVKRLSTLEKHTAGSPGKVVFSREFSRPVSMLPAVINSEDIGDWATLLQAGEREKLVESVKTRLRTAAQNENPDGKWLSAFRQDFARMIDSVLQEHGISTEEKFRENISLDIELQATQSVKKMLDWINHIVAIASGFWQNSAQSGAIVKKVTDYIQLNLDQDLSREEIAEYAYLNPDYLDRVFKKQVGLSVARYRTRMRVELVKNLLKNTDQPITVIAES